MILRSISVTNWRCFLGTVSVGPFADGLNIVHAPNGTGKTTLFAAMRHACLDGHKVTGKDVDALRPWGRALAPKVTVEFVDSGTEYRVTKQFLDDQSALLERKEQGRYRPLAEGLKADEQTRVLLTKNPPGRGLARLENWGLAQILWAPQGNLALLPLSSDLVTDIRSMLGSQVTGEGTDSIERRIEERYLEFFSPTGRPKGGKDASRLVRLEKELEEAREATREARRQYQEFDDTSRRVEDHRARRVQYLHDSEAIAKALNEAQERVETYRKLLAEKGRRTESAKAAEAQHSQLKQRIDLIRQTEKDLSDAKTIVAVLQADAPLKAREAQERAREAERTKAAMEDARKGRKAVDEAEQEAEDARRFCDATKARDELEALIKRVQSAQLALAEQQKKRSKLVAPDAKVMRSLRKAIKERDDAQVKLEASLITLEVVPDKNGRVEIVAGEQPGRLPMTAGVPTRIQGSPEVIAVIPGIARLRASGPSGTVEEHRDARAEAEKKIKNLTEPYGSSDPEVLEALSESAKGIDAAIAKVETEMEALLSGETLEEITQERNLHTAVLANMLETRPNWKDAAPYPLELRKGAKEVKDRFVSLIEDAEKEWGKAQSALVAAARQEEAALQRLKDESGKVASLEGKLAEYADDGKSAQERARELGQLSLAWDAAKTRLTELEVELTKYQDDPEEAAATLDRQHRSARDAADKARELEIREERGLEILGAHGPYSLLASAEEKVSLLEQQVNGERLHTDAIRLLRDTVVQCRTELISAVAQPVEDAATRIFQRIGSSRLGRIRVGESFQPSAVVPDALNDAVMLENISGGEQEQLYLAVRLALAEVLAKDERQLVALDDVLTATDAGRLARVMTVLAEAAQRLQILVLTCHPERYRGLRNAEFFDLEAVLHDRRQEEAP